MKKALLILLAGIVVVSACAGAGVGGVSYSTTSGVQINNFTFDMGTIYEGESAFLTSEIENVGSKTTTGPTYYWIYGPKITDPCTVTGTQIPTTWCRKATSSGISGMLAPGSFMPPVVKGTRGDIFVNETELKAPGQPEGIEWPYTFILRVCYPYNTTSTFAVTRYSTNEYRSGGAKKETEQLKRQSAGPIQIDMPASEALPMRAGTLSLKFTVSDVGGGFSLSDSACTSTKVDPEARSRKQVTFSVTVDGSDVGCTKTVRLSGTSTTVSCSANVGGQTDPTHIYQVVATGVYVYYLDKQASISVKSSSVA